MGTRSVTRSTRAFRLDFQKATDDHHFKSQYQVRFSNFCHSRLSSYIIIAKEAEVSAKIVDVSIAQTSVLQEMTLANLDMAMTDLADLQASFILQGPLGEKCTTSALPIRAVV